MGFSVEFSRTKNIYQVNPVVECGADNHIVVDVSQSLGAIPFVELEEFKGKLIKLTGDVVLFVSILNRGADISNLKYIINILYLNPDVSGVQIKLHTVDYEYYKSLIEHCIYAVPVNYSGKTPERFILRTKVLKFLGLNLGKNLIKFLSLFKN